MAAQKYGTYLGQTQTAGGKPIPVLADGTLDINALIAQTVDRRKIYYYDTLKLAPGATVVNTPYRFFATPVGQPDPYNGGQVKTYAETNMESPGMFNPPYDCIVNNLGFLFVQGNQIFDIQQVVTMGYFEFKILEKRMWWGHLWRHPPGAGWTGASTRFAESAWNNGVPSPDKIWHFGDYKKYIPPLVNFSLTLTFPETYNQYYNGVLPASVVFRLGAIGASLPTFKRRASAATAFS